MDETDGMRVERFDRAKNIEEVYKHLVKVSIYLGQDQSTTSATIKKWLTPTSPEYIGHAVLTPQCDVCRTPHDQLWQVDLTPQGKRQTLVNICDDCVLRLAQKVPMKTDIPSNDDLILCYVDGPWAYFTSQSLETQWGDDWDDAPYEHNAGEPYDDEVRFKNEKPWAIVKVAWDGPWLTPCERGACVSVKDINRGKVFSWLTNMDDYREIPAGTSLSEFICRIYESGGKVYRVSPY